MLLSCSFPPRRLIVAQCPQNHEQCLRSLTSRSIGGCTAEEMLALGRAFTRKLPTRGMSSGPASQLLTAREQHITWHDGGVSREAKEALLNQRGCVVWFTGLSGSGKSTVACTLEHALYRRGIATALLDGDNIRHGLNCNLGFSEEDRAENIRRVGEVTKLFLETGVITLASFISPYRADRELVRQRMGPRDFIEVYMKVCQVPGFVSFVLHAQHGCHSLHNLIHAKHCNWSRKVVSPGLLLLRYSTGSFPALPF